jgi:protein O-GlcNAc transferase
MLVLARKPAPVQATWMGYEGTTGLKAIDYLIADPHLIAAEAEPYCCERVLRLPDGYVCYEPPADAPEVGDLPALGGGRLTLASYNNPGKITREVIAAWSEILRRLPQARLVLKYRTLESDAARQRLATMFDDERIDDERVEMLGASAYTEYLASYRQVDLALDTFPFSGGITTCDALWMGVPVVTWPGETFASRHSLSHLSNAGATETVAQSRQEYVELAVALAGDLPRLAGLRAGLRQRVAASPLCDGPRLAANLLRLLRTAWGEYCRTA